MTRCAWAFCSLLLLQLGGCQCNQRTQIEKDIEFDPEAVEIFFQAVAEPLMSILRELLLPSELREDLPPEVRVERKDPFDPDHLLSVKKASVTPRPFPKAPKSQEEMRIVVLEDVQLELPVPATWEVKQGKQWARLEGPAFYINVSRCTKPYFTLNVSDQLKEEVAIDQVDEMFQAVKREWEQWKNKPKFELLLAVSCADAKSFGPEVPLPRRVVNLYLFVLKGVAATVPFYEDPQWQHYDWHHYESETVRAIIQGPYALPMTFCLPVGDFERFCAWVSPKGSGLVTELCFVTTSGMYGVELTLKDVLSFVGRCKLAKTRQTGHLSTLPQDNVGDSS